MLHKWWVRLLFLWLKSFKFEIQEYGQILCAHKPHFLMPGQSQLENFMPIITDIIPANI